MSKKDSILPIIDISKSVLPVVKHGKKLNRNERKAIKKNNFRLTSPLEIDYSQRDLVLTKEREKAKQFLDKALGSVH